MKHHVACAVLAIVTFAGHMVAGLYADSVYFLPEYIWFASVAFSVLAIYSGSITASRSEPGNRGKAIASAVIGVVILGGLLMSATSWLFIPENGFGMLTG